MTDNDVIFDHVMRNDFLTTEHWKGATHRTIRTFPLLACLIAPLSVLFDIPALAQPWYGLESQALTDDTVSLVLSAISLFLNIIANGLLMARFSIDSQRGYTAATRISMVFWILKAVVAITNLIIFGVYRNNAAAYEYLQGFWCAVISAVLASSCALMLLAHYLNEFNPSVALKNNAIRLEGRSFMINVTLLIVSIGVQGLIFCKIEHWTYLDGIYFSTVCVLTVGFGDFEPTTTAGKILLFPFVLVGIAQLALVVSDIIDFFTERSLDIVKATKMHLERERVRKEMTMDYVDLKEEIHLLEQQQKAEDNRAEMLSLSYSMMSFCVLWFIGALIFSQMEGWTYGNGLYFNYVFFLTLGFGDYAPTTAAARPVFIVYALISVPIITSFAVQSVTKAMSLLSERRLKRHKINVEKPAVPIGHTELLNEATSDLMKEIHREGLQDMLIETVLRLDISTRKIFSASLKGHSRLVMKADTLVQLRNTNFGTDDFVEQFHQVKIVEEIAHYRELFAKFLAAASAIRNLSGEEKRIFERRQKERTGDNDKSTSSGGSTRRERTASDNIESGDQEHRNSADLLDEDTGVGAISQRRLSQLGFTRSGRSMAHPNSAENSDEEEDSMEAEAEARGEGWKDRIKHNVEQAKGLNDPRHNREDADLEGGG